MGGLALALRTTPKPIINRKDVRATEIHGSKSRAPRARASGFKKHHECPGDLKCALRQLLMEFNVRLYRQTSSWVGLPDPFPVVYALNICIPEISCCSWISLFTARFDTEFVWLSELESGFFTSGSRLPSTECSSTLQSRKKSVNTKCLVWNDTSQSLKHWGDHSFLYDFINREYHLLSCIVIQISLTVFVEKILRHRKIQANFI